MAKSLRSKWRRKCRAIKRIRYGAKELERLKKTLGITDAKNEVDMQEIATVVDANAVQNGSPNKPNEEQMETDEKKPTLKRYIAKHGSYPVWVHQRKIKAAKKASKKANKKGRITKRGRKIR